MALSATVTSEIMATLQSFLPNPTVKKGSVYRQNIFLETIQCSFKLHKDSQGTYSHALYIMYMKEGAPISLIIYKVNVIAIVTVLLEINQCNHSVNS